MCGEMVDFGKSDKIIKVAKSNTYNRFSNNISLIIQERTSASIYWLIYFST